MKASPVPMASSSAMSFSGRAVTDHRSLRYDATLAQTLPFVRDGSVAAVRAPHAALHDVRVPGEAVPAAALEAQRLTAVIPGCRHATAAALKGQRPHALERAQHRVGAGGAPPATPHVVRRGRPCVAPRTTPAQLAVDSSVAFGQAFSAPLGRHLAHDLDAEEPATSAPTSRAHATPTSSKNRAGHRIPNVTLSATPLQTCRVVYVRQRQTFTAMLVRAPAHELDVAAGRYSARGAPVAPPD